MAPHPCHPDEIQRVHERIDRIGEELHETATKVATILDRLDRDSFVTRHEFRPVKAVVYGIAALALTAVGGALVKLVIVAAPAVAR